MDSKSSSFGSAGSIPALGTAKRPSQYEKVFLLFVCFLLRLSYTCFATPPFTTNCKLALVEPAS